MRNTSRPNVQLTRRRGKTTKTEFARQLGISLPFLANIEAGRKRPGLDTAARIEDLTGIPARSWERQAKAAA